MKRISDLGNRYRRLISGVGPFSILEAAMGSEEQFVEDMIEGIMAREGGGEYTEDPDDSGGPTRWGITEKTARENGYRGDMRVLPKEEAAAIYRKRYCGIKGIMRVYELHPALAERMIDFGVIAGQTTSVRYLQRCLNVLNRQEIDYPDIGVDGKIGAKETLPALRSFLKKRGDDGRKVLLGMVASMQSVYLIDLAERRPKDEKYQFGWQLNRAIGAIL